MIRKNKTVKRKYKLINDASGKRIKQIFGGGEIAPLKITEVIDLFLEIYSHPEYSAHLIQFFSDFQKEYIQPFPIEDIKADILTQEGIVRSQQKSLEKSENDVKTYVDVYFMDVRRRIRIDSPYTHRENIQALINGKYYYKPMISRIVYIALLNIQRFITDRTSHQFNKTITIHVLQILFNIIKKIIEKKLLEKSRFFEELKTIIADQFRNIRETGENIEALERIEKLLLQILYTLIENIISDPGVKDLYLTIIHDKLGEKDNDGNSKITLIEKWKTPILCYLEHSQDFVELLIDDDIIVLITHFISNNSGLTIGTAYKILFGKLYQCNAGLVSSAVSSGISSWLGYSKSTGEAKPTIDEEEKEKLVDELNRYEPLPGRLNKQFSFMTIDTSAPQKAIDTRSPQGVLSPTSHTETKKRRPLHYLAKRFGLTRKHHDE